MDPSSALLVAEDGAADFASDGAAENLSPARPVSAKRKRGVPATPDPDAEVVALSPRTLLSSSTFLCEVCGREFRRSQNLQIHRRGHKLSWNPGGGAPQAPGAGAARRRVYVCPDETCAHHDPSRALGDLTGIKKHYSRKHGERKWRCERCSRSYAVRADWRAHARVCGSRHYECGCGALFAGKDSLIAHRADCAATAEETDVVGSSSQALDFAARASTVVNSELLFPSLWGHMSAPGEEQRSPSNTLRESC